MESANRASAACFETHAADVYSWAYRVLGRHHDALDVVQDVFVRWVKQCGDTPPTQPRGWLRRVTLNRAIDLCRRRHPGVAAPDDALDGLAYADGGSQDAAVDRSDLRNDISSALDKLTDVQRGVLVAKVYDELSFSQIASELGLAVTTVKTHYVRAVAAVGDRLRPRWA